MPDFPDAVGGWLLDLLGFIGLGLGGAQAAATARLLEIQQDSLKLELPVTLTTAQLAEAVVKGALRQDQVDNDLHRDGMNFDRFDTLVKTTGNPPGPGELLDMLRREIIDDGRFAEGIRQGLIKTEWSDSIRAFRWQVMPVDDAVRGIVQNHMDEPRARNVARAHGVTDPDFDVLVENAGMPPGPMELLDLWDRGEITEADVDQGLRESRTKNRWIPALKKLSRRILTPSESVAAAVQGHMDYEQAAAAAARSGVERADFDVLYETAGNPPGPEAMLDLWRRGDIDEATLDQALRESRLKNKYIPALKLRARHLVPMRTVTTLLSHGAVTDGRAIEMLRQLGFTPDDAQAIVTAAHFEKAAPEKALTVSQVRDLYTEHLITRAQAVADLAAIHYPADVAGQVLDLAEHEIARRDRTSAITKIRNAYLTRRIDRANASGDLDTIGVEANQRDSLLSLWDLELDNAVAVLTPAQIVRAGKLQLFSQSEVVGRLEAHGYSEGDAVIVAMLGGAIPLPPAQPGG